MSKRYTPEEKASILQTLFENGSNIQRTSLQTGVPVRTLHAWRAEEQRKLQLLQPEKSDVRQQQQQTISFPDDPEFEEALRAEAANADAIIDRVLNQLLEQAQVLSARLSLNFDKAPPVSQMMALTRLIDRILKLDAASRALSRRTRST